MADNAALIRRIFDEVVNGGNIDLVDELFDPDFTTETTTGTFDREGFKDFVRGWIAGFPDVHCEVGDVVEEGDRIAWSVRSKGTHTGELMGIPPTGRAVDFLSINIGEVRDGRAYRHKLVMDLLGMLVQLGVVPDPTAAPAP